MLRGIDQACCFQRGTNTNACFDTEVKWHLAGPSAGTGHCWYWAEKGGFCLRRCDPIMTDQGRKAGILRTATQKWAAKRRPKDWSRER